MFLTRLSYVASNLCKIRQPKYLLLRKGIKSESTIAKLSTNVKNLDGSTNDKDLDDQPIPYSKTEAATWKARYNREEESHRVWYTPPVVALSLASFLIYFCLLREENDLDEIIYRPLPETLKGVDKLYPWVDFYKKPDYVRYHEENKIKKEKS